MVIGAARTAATASDERVLIAVLGSVIIVAAIALARFRRG